MDFNKKDAVWQQWATNTSWVRAALTGLSLTLVVAGAGCSKPPGEKEPVVTVQAEAAEKETIEHRIDAEALLFPLQQVSITPKITAPVHKFYVNRASKVHTGELLAVLENRDLAAASTESKGLYDQAEAAYTTTTGASLPEEIQKASLEVEGTQRALDAQQKVYTSRQELFQQGAMPRKELDQAGVDLTNAKNQYAIAAKHLEAMKAIGEKQTLKSAAAQLESAKGHYQGAEAQLSYSEIRSPINGVVTDRPLYPGETAAAGTPLLIVMDTSQVIAKAHIAQPDAALLKLGDKATLTVPGDEEKVDGKVTVISPALDPNSTTVEIWVQAANPKQRLRPGTNVHMTMLARTIKDAIIVPAAAVLTGQDGATTVMVVGDDGRAHQKPVKVGVRQGEDVQIVEGLNAGEKVVTAGAFGLPDKTKVMVEAAAPAGDEKPAAGEEKGAADDKKDGDPKAEKKDAK
jgi:multidrug efflux pump subunit AcrA (membrane-fusion protein)